MIVPSLLDESGYRLVEYPFRNENTYLNLILEMGRYNSLALILDFVLEVCYCYCI